MVSKGEKGEQRDLPNAMANDLDLAILRSLYYYVPCHKLYYAKNI